MGIRNMFLCSFGCTEEKSQQLAKNIQSHGIYHPQAKCSPSSLLEALGINDITGIIQTFLALSITWQIIEQGYVTLATEIRKQTNVTK